MQLKPSNILHECVCDCLCVSESVLCECVSEWNHVLTDSSQDQVTETWVGKENTGVGCVDSNVLLDEAAQLAHNWSCGAFCLVFFSLYVHLLPLILRLYTVNVRIFPGNADASRTLSNCAFLTDWKIWCSVLRLSATLVFFCCRHPLISCGQHWWFLAFLSYLESASGHNTCYCSSIT